jgi:hypothetical protein
MASPVNFNTFSEEDFIKFALDSLMANIRDSTERKYLTKTRLVKFIVFIAEKLNYTNLTYGWYRHGFYSPLAEAILNKKHVNSLSDYVSSDVKSKPEERLAIDRIINDYKGIFMKPREQFYDWVYKNKCPKKYKPLYKNNMQTVEFINQVIGSIKKDSYDPLINNKIENVITDYYTSLYHVKDEEILQAFCDFTDIFESMMLGLRNNKNRSKAIGYLGKLKEIQDRLYTYLTPYTNTLMGPKKEEEIKRFTEKSKLEIAKIRKELQDIQSDLIKENLWPSYEEMLSYTEELSKDLKPEELKKLERMMLS